MSLAALALTVALLGGGAAPAAPPVLIDDPGVVVTLDLSERFMPLDPFAPVAEPAPLGMTEPAVTVKPDAAFPVEQGVVAVTPAPPPPPPPPVPPPLAQAPTFDRAGAVARAAGSPNGQIPLDALCSLSWDASSLLRCDAAGALERAAAAGMPTVHLTDAYRSYAQQVAVKRVRGSYAATPGTSNHGEGLAIDVPEPARSWLHRNGAAYGWHNPAWARGYEPWHFLFTG